MNRMIPEGRLEFIFKHISRTERNSCSFDEANDWVWFKQHPEEDVRRRLISIREVVENNLLPGTFVFVFLEEEGYLTTHFILPELERN
jgi:hypothetical protein